MAVWKPTWSSLGCTWISMDICSRKAAQQVKSVPFIGSLRSGFPNWEHKIIDLANPGYNPTILPFILIIDLRFISHCKKELEHAVKLLHAQGVVGQTSKSPAMAGRRAKAGCCALAWRAGW